MVNYRSNGGQIEHNDSTCWVCRGSKLSTVLKGNMADLLTETDFRITNSDYGKHAEIFECKNCGFHQCTHMTDVLKYYEGMEDDEYEKTRKQRAFQEAAVLKRLNLCGNENIRLLDVGAGSGILVSEANKMGLDAEGVEPSKSLQEIALSQGLKVHLGTLPHNALKGTYDVITLIDVIEHVPNPLEVLQSIAQYLSESGRLVVVTPDRKSKVAKIMGKKWWHLRVAHIGYFDYATIRRALRSTGYEIVSVTRPGWYFPLDYLFVRLLSYLPTCLRVEPPKCFSRVTVKLNLRDSLEITAVKAPPQNC
jgi:SAM-dependent methyltransferase